MYTVLRSMVPIIACALCVHGTDAMVDMVPNNALMVAQSIAQNLTVENFMAAVCSLTGTPKRLESTCPITDAIIETANPWCKYLKVLLQLQQKNTLLRCVLRDKSEKYASKKRGAIICLVYIGANPNIAEYQDKNMDVLDGWGIRPLQYIAYDDHYLVHYLLEKGADPTLTVDQNGNYPIFLARNIVLAELLIKHGASVKTIREHDGATLLHICTGKYYDPTLIQWYIEKYALKANSLSKTKETPLHYLVKEDYFPFGLFGSTFENHEMVQKINILKKAGAQLNAKDDNDCKPVDAALCMLHMYLNQLYEKLVLVSDKESESVDVQSYKQKVNFRLKINNMVQD